LLGVPFALCSTAETVGVKFEALGVSMVRPNTGNENPADVARSSEYLTVVP
jgi:hypothetical protein